MVTLASMEMAHNYIKNIACGIYHMELLEEVIIEGHNEEPHKAEEIIAAGMYTVKAAAGKLAAVTA